MIKLVETNKKITISFLEEKINNCNKEYEALLKYQNACLNNETIDGESFSEGQLILFQNQLIDNWKLEIENLVRDFKSYLLENDFIKKQSLNEVFNDFEEHIKNHVGD